MKKFILLSIIFSACIFAQVSFDADFESGNLLSVTTTDSVNFTVRTREDIGGRWFYFRIKNVKNKFIRVTVQNSDVKRAMYSYDDITYTRFTAAESPSAKVFQKTFENDSVYVAYYTPYTFSFLQKRINEWKDHPHVKVDTLGFTTRNFPMQEIRITDSSVPDDQKERVWIHSRTHPGETPSSWQFDGIVQALLQNNDFVNYWKKKVVFHLIPFTNPEGVYYGRSRTNYDGIDIERDWDFPSSQTTTEVTILKQRMLEVNNSKVIKVFLNLHSQAASYCTFWIHTASSTSSYFYKREHQFSNLQISGIPYFVMSDYRYSNLQSYFPEGWLWNNYNDAVMALTYETPYDKYSNNELVTNYNLAEIGYRTIYAVAEYLELSHPRYVILDNKDAVKTGYWNTDTTGMLYYSDDFSTAAGGNGTNKINYSTNELEPGKYDVWAWWPSNTSFAFNTKFKITGGSDSTEIVKTQKINGGQWNFLTNYTLDQNGQLNIEITDEAAGTVAADAFRIIFKEPVTGVRKDIIADGFTLHQNYPNPFNPSTRIRFELDKREKVQLRIFSSVGELIAVLVDEELTAGTHEIIFDASSYPYLSSGIYYYHLSSAKASKAKGMVLVK